MNIGSMRERVTIKKYTTVQSATGATTDTETTVATVWANIKAVRGTEAQDAGRLAAKQTYLVTIYTRTLETGYFLLWGTKKLNIRSISDRWEQNKGVPGQFLTIEAEDGVQS
ncbi:phage head closure protein [Paremcibacter congregatus]|uniref:phage head closure protein n=1 Tax=Paremcibacter congregatus TaxID=2043170 RepID=UPI0030EF7860|tara:strand:- start:5657 stop:5992 length:336 start_codon:yes stop_codon:yes gene_type:complete